MMRDDEPGAKAMEDTASLGGCASSNWAAVLRDLVLVESLRPPCRTAVWPQVVWRRVCITYRAPCWVVTTMAKMVNYNVSTSTELT